MIFMQFRDVVVYSDVEEAVCGRSIRLARVFVGDATAWRRKELFSNAKDAKIK